MLHLRAAVQRSILAKEFPVAARSEWLGTCSETCSETGSTRAFCHLGAAAVVDNAAAVVAVAMFPAAAVESAAIVALGVSETIVTSLKSSHPG